MKKKLGRKIIIIFSILLLNACGASQQRVAQIQKNSQIEPADLMAATGRLELYIVEDKLLRGCTATAFERKGDTYRFLTVAHCMTITNGADSEIVLLPFNFRIKLEKSDGKTEYYPAEVIFWRQSKLGSYDYEDYAVVEAKIDREIPVIPLSDTDPVLKEEFTMVTAAPLHIGNQFYEGYIRRENIVVEENEEVVDNVCVISTGGLGEGRGASGAAIVSKKQAAIVAMIIAGLANNKKTHITPLAVKILKFRKAYSEFKKSEKKSNKGKQ